MIIFNRPDLTKRVLSEIARRKPKRLFVIADGPRESEPEDEDQCEKAREVADTVDWNCQVERCYSDMNLGGRVRVASGLDWVFSRCEQAIVFEDDTVPNPTFFDYCEELLGRFRHDERVMSISGNNFQFGTNGTSASYYYSRYAHCWGWATWSRAWRYYDDDLTLWPELRTSDWLLDILGDPAAALYWQRIFDRIHDGRITYSWAYRWLYSCWVQNGLTILPNVNLVANIGFGPQASHTKNVRSIYSNMPTGCLEVPLKHPRGVIRQKAADDFTFKKHFCRSQVRFLKLFVKARLLQAHMMIRRLGQLENA